MKVSPMQRPKPVHYISRAARQSKRIFNEKNAQVINCEILGSGYNKWQFEVPLETSKHAGEGTVIGTINIENTKIRELVDNIATDQTRLTWKKENSS